MENNYPPNLPMNSVNKPKRRNTWIYLGIILLLLATNILLFTQKNKSEKNAETATEQFQQQQVATENLQIQYNAALARLDDLTGKNTALDRMIADRDSEIARMKSRIESILKDKNATEEDLVEARGLIKQLNTRISGYEQQIAQLKQDNTNLTMERDKATADNKKLTETNEALSDQVVLGKVLQATNIKLIPVELKSGGTKEVETTRARRVDILRITFDLEENRLIESGPQEIYARIINPEGKLLSNSAMGSGTFHIKDVELPQYYTINKKISINKGDRIREISMDWQQTASYIKGNYTIELYNQGYMIGKQVGELR